MSTSRREPGVSDEEHKERMLSRRRFEIVKALSTHLDLKLVVTYPERTARGLALFAQCLVDDCDAIDEGHLLEGIPVKGDIYEPV